MLLYLLVSAVAVLLIYIGFHVVPPVFSHLRTGYRLKKVPLPTLKGNYFIGLSLTFVNFFFDPPKMSLSSHILYFTLGLSEIFRKKGLFKLDTGYIDPTIFVFRSDYVSKLLKESGEFKKSKEYRISYSFLGGGLLSSEPTKWKKDRKALQPAFHSQVLSSFQTTLNTKSQEFVVKLAKLLNREVACLEAMFENFLLDSVCESCLGYQIEDHETEIHPLADAINIVADAFVAKTGLPWYWVTNLHPFIPGTRTYNKHVRFINEYSHKIMLNGKKSALNFDNQNDDSLFDKKRIPFLQLMFQNQMTMKSKEMFTDEDIVDHIKNLLLAGFDAPGACMIWTAYFLGWYQEIQEKVRAEIDDIFKDDTQRAITVDDVKDMVYLEMVIKEVLRTVPSGPIIGRTLEKDLQLGEYNIPKGTSVYVQILALHRDPEVYPNPEVFDPERFRDSSRHPFAYLPFSGGPRNCIGFNFAMQEIKTCFADMLRNFHWQALDPPDMCIPELSTLTAHPRNNIRFIFRRRTTN